MNDLEFDRKLERIIELCDARKEIERELSVLLGKTPPDEDQEKTKRRVVRYEYSMEEYVLQLLNGGILFTRDELFRQIRNVAGATVLRPTVNNAISSLIRKGVVERAPDGENLRLKAVPSEPQQATLAPPEPVELLPPQTI